MVCLADLHRERLEQGVHACKSCKSLPVLPCLFGLDIPPSTLAWQDNASASLRMSPRP